MIVTVCAHLAEVVSAAAAERFVSDHLRCISGLLLQVHQRRPATAGYLYVPVCSAVVPPSDVPSSRPVHSYRCFISNSVLPFITRPFYQPLAK